MYIRINISCQEILRNNPSSAKHFRGRSDQRESTCIGSSLRPEAVGRPAVVNMMPDVGNLFPPSDRKTEYALYRNLSFYFSMNRWYAIKTKQDFRAETTLKPKCDEVFFPKDFVRSPAGVKRLRAIIPHVLFIKTSPENALALEAAGRTHPELSIPFWIYRYPQSREIQIISEEQINLLKLLTATDTTRCEIFCKQDFSEGQRVRIIGGPFKGYEGFVQRVKKNRHVIVKIEGICLVMLPFIHPDLLQPI